MRGFGLVAIAAMGVGVLTGCWQGPRPAAAAPLVTVRVEPAAVALTVGRSMTFAAKVEGGSPAELAWTVLEPGGGAVDGAGRYQAPASPGVYTVQAGFGALAAGRARVTVVAPPAGEITAPQRVLPGADNLQARVPEVAGSRYAWTIAGGLLTAGAETSAATFRAGTGSKVNLTCAVTNAAGDTLRSSLEVPVVPQVTLAITPPQVTITAGRTMKFGFTITGGTTLGVAWSLGEPGAGSLDGAGNYVAPLVPGAYTVRVSAQDDPTRAATARVKVVPQPSDSLFAPEAFTPGAAGLRARVPNLPGMAYLWEIEGGTITGGATGPVLEFQAGSGDTLTVRCRVTNEAGDSVLVARTLKSN